jgi:hypothetical protein
VKPVKSTSISHVGHDPATSTLSIRFSSGDTYQYQGVSAADHANLIAAPSIGSHFQRYVRPKFKGTLKCG